VSAKKSLKQIESMLFPGEQIVATVHATIESSWLNSNRPIGVLALTDKRFVFAGQIGLKTDQHAIALNSVQIVGLNKSAMLAHLSLQTMSGTETYRVKWSEAEPFAKIAQQAVFELQNS
jgi:hypothetical protein